MVRSFLGSIKSLSCRVKPSLPHQGPKSLSAPDPGLSFLGGTGKMQPSLRGRVWGTQEERPMVGSTVTSSQGAPEAPRCFPGRGWARVSPRGSTSDLYIQSRTGSYHLPSPVWWVVLSPQVKPPRLSSPHLVHLSDRWVEGRKWWAMGAISAASSPHSPNSSSSFAPDGSSAPQPALQQPE